MNKFKYIRGDFIIKAEVTLIKFVSISVNPYRSNCFVPAVGEVAKNHVNETK